MNKQDILRMAKEAGATPYTNRHYPDRPTHTFTVEQLERFFHMAQAAAVEQERKEFAVHAIDIARKAIEERDKFWQNHMEPQIEIEVKEAILEERESCAKVCENLVLAHPGRADMTADQCAAAIRARGNP
jgi:hypothetical protein